jgi:hypothetical protein
MEAQTERTQESGTAERGASEKPICSTDTAHIAADTVVANFDTPGAAAALETASKQASARDTERSI